MQRLLSLTVLVLGLGWILFWGREGRWDRAFWALLILLPQAPILALETLWAALVARRVGARRALGSPGAAPEPYPGLMTWLSSWVQEVVASVQTFAWRQPWAHARWPDHLPSDAQGRRGVLLVHGFVCNRGFWNPWMSALRAARVPHVAVSLEPPFGDIALQAQGLQEAWQRLVDATGTEPLLVGHSMGGLVIRHWLAGLPDAQALRHEVITIGSPHHGTALAVWAHSTAAQQMQLLSPFLRDLSARESEARRSRMTCYWSVCDNIVFPASTATLPGAHNIAVAGRPHVALAQDPDILKAVLARCSASASRT